MRVRHKGLSPRLSEPRTDDGSIFVFEFADVGVDLALVVDQVALGIEAVALPEAEELAEAEARALKVGDPNQLADRLGGIVSPVLAQVATDQIDGGGEFLEHGEEPLQLLLGHLDLIIELVVLPLDR